MAQFFCKNPAYLVSPRNHDLTNSVVFMPGCFCQFLNSLCFGEHKNMVELHQPTFSVWQNGCSTSRNCNHSIGVVSIFNSKLSKGFIHNGGVFFYPNSNKLHFSLCKRNNIACRSTLNEPVNFSSGTLFRVYQNVNTKLGWCNWGIFLRKLIISYASYGRLYTEPFSHHTSNDVNLIHTGTGYNHIRIFCACTDQSMG